MFCFNAENAERTEGVSSLKRILFHLYDADDLINYKGNPCVELLCDGTFCVVNQP